MGNDNPAIATEPSTETGTPPVVEEVAEHVDDAASTATEAANVTGEDGWKVIADELKGLRSDINKLMKSSRQAAPSPPAPETPPVEVEVPTPPERKVRRGNRKVTRRG